MTSLTAAVVVVRCPVSGHILFEARGGRGPATWEIFIICRCKRRVRVAPDGAVTIASESETRFVVR